MREGSCDFWVKRSSLPTLNGSKILGGRNNSDKNYPKENSPTRIIQTKNPAKTFPASNKTKNPKENFPASNKMKIRRNNPTKNKENSPTK